MQHIDHGELALYIVGALGPARATRLEAHIVDCDACGEALAAEAALEFAFEQIAGAAPAMPSGRSVPPRSPSPNRFPRRGWVVATAGGLSLAAAWALVLLSDTRAPTRSSAAGTVGGGSRVATLVSDAMTTGLDERYLDPLDGG